MTPKILLLEPLQPESERWGSFSKERGVNPPLGLLSIYAYMKQKGFDVDLVDTQIEPVTEEQLAARLRGKGYDIVGIPVFTVTAYAAFHTAELIRKTLPDALIVFGNIHVSSLPEATLRECPEVDVIVVGEGEETFEELVTKYAGKRVVAEIGTIRGLAYRQGEEVRINECRPLIEDLDRLPSIFAYVPVDAYVPFPHYYRRLPCVSNLTQRGCPFSCSFCSATIVHGRRTRFKSVGYVIKELLWLKERYGIRSVYFQDSTMTVNKQYVLDLCRAMREAKLDVEWSCFSRVDRVDDELLKAMKDAGCWQICYGVESGNEASLKIINKGGRVSIPLIEESIAKTKKAGISVLASFILCLPGEDEAMVRKTIDFALKLAPHTALFYLPIPFPGTKLYDYCKEHGGLRAEARWLDYIGIDFDNPVYVNPLIGKEKMKELYNLAWRRFYFSPRIWWVNLKSLRSAGELVRYQRAGRALLRMLTRRLRAPFRKGKDA